MTSNEEESTVVWIPREFDYEKDLQKKLLPRVKLDKTEHHPLKGITVKESSAVRLIRNATPTRKKAPAAVNEFIDPLSALAASPVTDVLDPLTALSISNTSQAKSNKLDEEYEQEKRRIKEEEATDGGFENWSSRRLKILNRYTTDQKLSMTMTSLASGAGLKEASRRQQGAATVSDKMKSRLEQLDDFEEGGLAELQSLTQQEFIDKIHELNTVLRNSWSSNQKVKALKIAIQCAKLLNDVSVLSFYPSKFVLVSDLLDTFGDLVFQRILSKCGGGMTADTINPDKIDESAKEICVNWMLKIASIRELLPRLLIEATTIRCNNFMKAQECNTALVRLTSMTRGIGDPLVALYVRAFICHVGMKYTPGFKGHLTSIFHDFMKSYSQIHSEQVRNTLAAQRLTIGSYLNLFIPALEWVLACLARNNLESNLSEILEKCLSHNDSSLLLHCCVNSFKSSFIATNALIICTTVIQSKDKNLPKFEVIKAIGKKVVEADPPKKERLTLLNEVWKFLVKLTNNQQYIECAQIWVEYAAKHFTKKEVNTILGDIIGHVSSDRSYEKFYPQLESTLSKILTHVSNFTDVFAMDKLLPFLDMFQSDEKRSQLSQIIAKFFIQDRETFVDDTVVINGMMYACKAMHDNLSALATDEDRKHISTLISGVISKITFNKDFEQQLAFYVTCRSTLYNLDAVLSCLVHHVNHLTVQVCQIVKNNHTKRTSTFVRACVAYTYITIPSLSDNQEKLLLYMESGQVALLSQCTTQADAMYRSAISLLKDALRSPDSNFIKFLPSFSSNLLSNLLLVPDNTDKGVLYLLRGFLNIIIDSTPLPGHVRCQIFIKVLSLLTAYSQEHYIYSVSKVDSNEILYCNDKKFLREIRNMSCGILDEILGYLSSPANEQSKHRSACAVQLMEHLLAHADLKDEEIKVLVADVWKTVKKSEGSSKIVNQLYRAMKNREGFDIGDENLP